MPRSVHPLRVTIGVAVWAALSVGLPVGATHAAEGSADRIHSPSDTLTHADKTKRTDELFAEMAGTSAPGCAVGVVNDGILVFQRGYGSGNLEFGAPLDSRSSFYLASVSKQFVAAAIGVLALDGAIDLDDEVRKYVPEVPEYEHRVTVRHLVHHVSGVRDYLTLFMIGGRSFQDFFDNGDAIDLVSRQKALNFEPGSEYLYSNSGYVLLSEIVERVSGMSLQDFSKKRLFHPLGMYDTHWGEDVSAVIPGRVDSYEERDDGAIHRFIWNFHGKGDGNLHSSVQDLARWDAMYYRTDEPWASLIDLTLTKGVLNDGSEIRYAFGLGHGEYREHATVGHSGGMLGYRTNLMRFPEDRFSTIVLCNLGSINPAEWALKLADIWLFGDDGPMDSTEEATAAAEAEDTEEESTWQPSVSDLEAFAGEYYSEELDATYRMAVQEGALMVFPRRGDTTVLEPSEPDTFKFGGFMTLSFSRDGRRVSGFTMDAGRVRELGFEKR